MQIFNPKYWCVSFERSFQIDVCTFKRHHLILSYQHILWTSYQCFASSPYFTLLCVYKQGGFISAASFLMFWNCISSIGNPPYTIEDVPIWENTNVEVRSEDVVEPSNFLVPAKDLLNVLDRICLMFENHFIFSPEKCVRHPHLRGISHCQVADFIWNNSSNSVVIFSLLI